MTSPNTLAAVDCEAIPWIRAQWPDGGRRGSSTGPSCRGEMACPRFMSLGTRRTGRRQGAVAEDEVRPSWKASWRWRARSS